MILRMSTLFLRTLRQDPADAEVPSHRLLVRAGAQVEALAAPDTINTMPEKTLAALADHGELTQVLPDDCGDSAAVLDECRRAGIDDKELAQRLQREGAEAFSKSWRELLQQITHKAGQLQAATS